MAETLGVWALEMLRTGAEVTAGVKVMAGAEVTAGDEVMAGAEVMT